MFNIRRMLGKDTNLNRLPKIVIKGNGRMLNNYSNMLKKDWKGLNSSDKYLVKKIEIYPKLRGEDGTRIYGQALPITSTIKISMTRGHNHILSHREREKTLMHEIGHLKYYHLPNSEKDRIANEEEYSYGEEKDLKRYYVVRSIYDKKIVGGPTTIFRARQLYSDLEEEHPTIANKYRVEELRI